MEVMADSSIHCYHCCWTCQLPAEPQPTTLLPALQQRSQSDDSDGALAKQPMPDRKGAGMACVRRCHRSMSVHALDQAVGCQEPLALGVAGAQDVTHGHGQAAFLESLCLAALELEQGADASLHLTAADAQSAPASCQETDTALRDEGPLQ